MNNTNLCTNSKKIIFKLFLSFFTTTRKDRFIHTGDQKKCCARSQTFVSEDNTVCACVARVELATMISPLVCHARNVN